jgi:hypothetical protein
MFFTGEMDTYRPLVLRFPLPNELKEKILWFLLCAIMNDKIGRCLPSDCDLFQKQYNDVGGWEGHSHTTTASNFVYNRVHILAYDHIFYTDCAMWVEHEEGAEVDLEVSEEAHRHEIYFRTHTFGLLKRGIMREEFAEDDDSFMGSDEEEEEYIVNYISQIYLDGSARLVNINIHK